MEGFDFALSEDGVLALPAPCAGDAIEIALARLDVTPETVQAASALLSGAELQRANRFVFACDRRRFVVARSHLRRLLGARLNVRPEAVELVYGKRGKPALAQRFAGTNLHFNVAHSDDVAVFAFSAGLEIGVDIETVRSFRDADEIAALHFSHGEYESYRSLARGDRPLGFFTCWTRKEAFLKALGHGLYHPLDSFDVSAVPDAPASVLPFENLCGERRNWEVHSFFPGSGLVGAVALGRRADEAPGASPPDGKRPGRRP